MNKHINTAKDRERKHLENQESPYVSVPVVALPEIGHEGSILVNMWGVWRLKGVVALLRGGEN